MFDLSPELAENKDEQFDASKCLTNLLGLAKMGMLTNDEISEIIAKRDSVGKGNRSRYGRLLCEFEGCEAICNVESVDGIPVETRMDQSFKLLKECVVFNQTTIQPGDVIV